MAAARAARYRDGNRARHRRSAPRARAASGATRAVHLEGMQIIEACRRQRPAAAAEQCRHQSSAAEARHTAPSRRPPRAGPRAAQATAATRRAAGAGRRPDARRPVCRRANARRAGRPRIGERLGRSFDHDRTKPGIGEGAGDAIGAAVGVERHRRQRHCGATRRSGHGHALTPKTRPQMPRLTIRHSEKSTGRRPSSISPAWARTPDLLSRSG